MQADLENFFYRAEDHYLQPPEMLVFKHHLNSMDKRLETYRCLRDREIAIFQPVADQLLEAFPQETPQRLERALQHWLSTLRYCAMAMLLNSPKFLEHRLLEWLTDIIKAYELELLEQYLYELLQENLKAVLSIEQFGLIGPFLEQAQTTLLVKETANEQQAVMLGENT